MTALVDILRQAAGCSRHRRQVAAQSAADRCRRGRPLPDDLHQRNPGMGRRELVANRVFNLDGFFGADWHSSCTHAYDLPPSATISLMLCFTSDFEKSEETGDVGLPRARTTGAPGSPGPR